MRAAVMMALVAGCAMPRTAATPEATPEELARGRAFLAELRASAPAKPYVARVAVTMLEPRSGRTLDARGAVAVDPGRAMRMILVGPGGATALDAWVTPTAWRFAVPALEIVKRGTASARGLPVGFFRWWFLSPMQGDLVRARDGSEARRGELLLKSGAAVEDVTYFHGETTELRIERRGNETVERLRWLGSLAPHAGDRGTYGQPESGLRVDIVVEATSDDAPPADSFVDPDAAGGVK